MSGSPQLQDGSAFTVVMCGVSLVLALVHGLAARRGVSAARATALGCAWTVFFFGWLAAAGAVDRLFVLLWCLALVGLLRLPAVHGAWRTACLLFVACLIAIRWIRYQVVSPGPSLDSFLGALMVEVSQSFLWSWVSTQFLSFAVGSLWDFDRFFAILVVVVALLAAGVVLSRSFHREAGRIRFRPLLVSALCAGMVWFHYLVDANAFIAGMCGSTLVLAFWGLGRGARGRGSWGERGVWLLLVLAWLVSARDPSDRLVVILWVLYLGLALRFLPRALGPAELRWALLVSVIPANLLAAFLPLVLPLHGGTLLGPELAYDFCEVPGGALYAALPQCSSVSHPSACRDGVIAEYDAATLERRADHRFFSDDFTGRFEHLVCMDDAVAVTVQAARHGGEDWVHSVLSFPVASPRDFSRDVSGSSTGSGIAYDRRRDALFSSSEFSHVLMRVDRRTGERTAIDEEGMRRPWRHPIFGQALPGSLGVLAIDPLGDRVYAPEWFRGRSVHAVDLETLRAVARYEVNGGGAWGIAVDPVRRRLLVPSMWGFEVVDLDTGRVVARRRLGLGTKEPELSASGDRIFVASSAEGKLRVLDGETLELIRQIPIGFATRHPLGSADGRRLYASSLGGHFVFELGPPPTR